MLIKSSDGRIVRQHTLPDLPKKVIRPRRIDKGEQQTAILQTLLDETGQQLQAALTTIDSLRNDLAEQRELRFQEGFDAGRKDGYDAGMREIESRIHKFTELTADMQNRQVELMRQSEDFLSELALRAVEKIVGSEQAGSLRLDKSLLMKMLDSVVERFAGAPRVVFHVNHESLEVLEQNRAEIGARLPGKMSFTIVDDPSLAASDCVIESDFGLLDGRIEARLREIQNLFGSES